MEIMGGRQRMNIGTSGGEYTERWSVQRRGNAQLRYQVERRIRDERDMRSTADAF